jgi:D-aspartate ligase
LEQNKVIILGSHFNALSMTQIFGKEGIPVEVMADIKDQAGRSKYAKWIKSPNPINAPNAFKNFLTAHCKKHHIKPVIIPSMDQWAFLLAQCDLEKKGLAYTVVDTIETLSLVLNKDQFNNYCEEKKFSIPKIFSIAHFNTIPASSFPLIAKPNFRMSPDQEEAEESLSAAVNRYRLRKFLSKEELQLFIEKTPRRILDLLVLQEYISGNSDCMITYGVYCENGNVLGDFEGRKVRGYPHEYGDCMVGKQEKIPAFIKAESQQLLKAINYNGIAEVEYKIDSQKGSYHLIEINPRSWSWVGITQFTKHNLPLLAYQSKLGLTATENKQEVKDKEVLFRRRTYDRFNCLYRYKKTYPAWSMSKNAWKKSFEEKFVYDIEAAHKDYMQWIYTFLKNNLILYVNWFLRNK